MYSLIKVRIIYGEEKALVAIYGYAFMEIHGLQIDVLCLGWIRLEGCR